jgi:hypothetical protein
VLDIADTAQFRPTRSLHDLFLIGPLAEGFRQSTVQAQRGANTNSIRDVPATGRPWRLAGLNVH